VLGFVKRPEAAPTASVPAVRSGEALAADKAHAGGGEVLQRDAAVVDLVDYRLRDAALDFDGETFGKVGVLAHVVDHGRVIGVEQEIVALPVYF